MLVVYVVLASVGDKNRPIPFVCDHEPLPSAASVDTEILILPHVSVPVTFDEEVIIGGFSTFKLLLSVDVHPLLVDTSIV